MTRSSPALFEKKSTRQILSLTPRGSEFQAGVKKIPSSAPHQSIGLGPGFGRGRFHMSYGAAMYGLGRGSEIFSTCVRRPF
jgi:hypothetical protein